MTGKTRIVDPAYDLAIVTRGNRKVFGVGRGLDLLLESYLSAGGVPIIRRDIHCHELLMFLKWHWEASDARRKVKLGGQGPEFHEARIKNLLSRAESA